MKQTLKIGDSVIIRKSSKWYKTQSKHGVGKIEFFENDGYISVIFKDGFNESYRESELQLIKPKSKKVCVHCGKEYKKDERCIGRVGGYYHELESKIKKVKKFSTDGEHFYINKQPVCEKEFLEQSKNIREIDKIKDIIKSNKLQYPNPFGKYIQVKRYNEILLPKIENELIEMLLATQPQPIKEDRKECKHKFGETYTGGKRCNKCNMSLTEFKYSTPSPLELPKINNNFSSMEQYNWAKQITDEVNKLYQYIKEKL